MSLYSSVMLHRKESHAPAPSSFCFDVPTWIQCSPWKARRLVWSAVNFPPNGPTAVRISLVLTLPSGHEVNSLSVPGGARRWIIKTVLCRRGIRRTSSPCRRLRTSRTSGSVRRSPCPPGTPGRSCRRTCAPLLPEARCLASKACVKTLIFNLHIPFHQ